MPTDERATAVVSSHSSKTLLVLSDAACAAVPLKVGDHVTREPVLEGGEDNTYYRVRKIDSKANQFEVDPNSPFEKAWKGRLSDFKPHHVYPGYWVPKVLGVTARAALKAKKNGVQQYEVAVNWHKEVIKTSVTASSKEQAVVVASHKLATRELRAFTQQHVYRYMINNEDRVTVTNVK